MSTTRTEEIKSALEVLASVSRDELKSFIESGESKDEVKRLSNIFREYVKPEKLSVIGDISELSAEDKNEIAIYLVSDIKSSVYRNTDNANMARETLAGVVSKAAEVLTSADLADSLEYYELDTLRKTINRAMKTKFDRNDYYSCDAETYQLVKSRLMITDEFGNVYAESNRFDSDRTRSVRYMFKCILRESKMSNILESDALSKNEKFNIILDYSKHVIDHSSIAFYKNNGYDNFNSSELKKHFTAEQVAEIRKARNRMLPSKGLFGFGK